MPKTYRITIALFILTQLVSAQQITIPRIDLMPDLPQPYLMRDWKQVAWGYDSMVFDQTITGPYLPLVFFRTSNVNYPDHQSFGLHTAIGTVNPNSGEAINVIPAVIGASLVGIDKSDQFGQNWALMCEEYFNKRPGENIYLNHPESSSGDDWWYETMPNVFFMQLNSLYPHLGEFDYQVETMADQMLAAVINMGGGATPWQVPYMNYRAWSMSTMSPLETGVKEPEAAGAIAWILFNAYNITGKRKYLIGAEWSLEYLNSYTGNPSYELQLPYGVYAAARLNAELGTGYDIEKMVNWCFNRGELRGWGTIVGKWGDYDCSGLVGEANDEGNDYAFAMNGFEQAGALVPMVRYDDRFATAIGKWVLNLANASRLFYPNYLPDNMQDNENWAHNYDPDSYIAYESMKESKYGKSPYATGDAMDGGWAATNLMLYSSSHVGILGGIIETTNIEGILQLDLLKTDYYRNTAYPTYMYFNPFDAGKTIQINLPEGSFDLYDAVSNAMLKTSVSGNVSTSIPAKEAIMLVHIPAGTSITTKGNITYAGAVPIDYNNGTTVSDYPPRIKALTAESDIIETGAVSKIYCTASDREQQTLKYKWTIDGVSIDSSDIFEFVSTTPGIYTVKCEVSDPGLQSDTLSIQVKVVEKVMYPPEILKIEASTRKADLSASVEFNCEAADLNQDTLTYTWTANCGGIVADGNKATFIAPGSKNNCFIVCSVTDTDGMTAMDSLEVMVRDLSVTLTGNLIAYYPMNGNAMDASGTALHGIPDGVSWVEDKNGVSGNAVLLNGTSDNIRVTNAELLNFQDAISVVGWINIDEFTGAEQYPVSHGNWDHRYKISVSNNKFRFTLNTSSSVEDLDSDLSLAPGQWYHLAAVYNGEDMEIWVDGKLNAFTALNGLINKTSYDLVFGQHLPGENGNNFKGSLDEISIFDYALSEAQIVDYMENGIGINVIYEQEWAESNIRIFPNPAGNTLQIEWKECLTKSVSYKIIDLSGNIQREDKLDVPIIDVSDLTKGLYILNLKTDKEVISKKIRIE